MKQDYTKFKCDICNKEIEIERNAGYPYEKGWCFLYNFTAKFLRSYTPAIDIDVGKTEQKDRHFCSEKCMFVFLRKAVSQCKKIKPEPINLEECKEIYDKTRKWDKLK